MVVGFYSILWSAIIDLQYRMKYLRMHLSLWKSRPHDPLYAGTMPAVPWYPGTMVRWYHALVPCHPAVPWYAGGTMPDQPWDTGVRANQCTCWTTSSPGNCFLPPTICFLPPTNCFLHPTICFLPPKFVFFCQNLFSSVKVSFLPPEFSNLSPLFRPFPHHIVRLVQSGKCFDISSSRINKSHWVSATLEFWHKEWLLTLETLQTFDQSDV